MIIKEVIVATFCLLNLETGSLAIHHTDSLQLCHDLVELHDSRPAGATVAWCDEHDQRET